MNGVFQPDSDSTWMYHELQKRDHIIQQQTDRIEQLQKELEHFKSLVERNGNSTETAVDENVGPFGKRYWSSTEHKLFLEGLNKFGRSNWKNIAAHVKTRTPDQVRTHAQKYFLSISKPKKEAPDTTSPVAECNPTSGKSSRKRQKVGDASPKSQCVAGPSQASVPIVAKIEPALPAMFPRNPQKEHFANSTWDLIVEKIPDWSIAEHCIFIDGFFFYSTNDMHERALLIWKNLLPQRSFDTIQLCVQLMRYYTNASRQTAPPPPSPIFCLPQLPPVPPVSLPAFGCSFNMNGALGSQDDLFRSMTA